MRGFLYEISKEPGYLGELTADGFAFKEEEREIGAEWYNDENDDTRDLFLDKMERLDAEIIDRNEETEEAYFVFNEDVRRNYFSKRYDEFMEFMAYIQKMADINRPEDNIAIFASEQINELQRIIEDTYGDAVWLADENRALTMDAFMRTAEAGATYYVGNVICMH